MTGASIGKTTCLSFGHRRCGDVKGRMRPLFTQERGGGVSVVSFLDGLLGAEPRKTGWMRAEAAGDRAPMASRRSWAEDDGTSMRCATLCATTRRRRSNT